MPASTGIEHYDIALGLQLEVQALQLVGPYDSTPLPDNHVYVFQSASQRTVNKPAVLISISSEPEDMDVLDDKYNEATFRCHVTTLVERDQQLQLDVGNLSWRKIIRDHFLDKWPSDLPLLAGNLLVDLLRVTWIPGAVFNPELFRASNLIESSAVVLVTVVLPERP